LQALYRYCYQIGEAGKFSCFSIERFIIRARMSKPGGSLGVKLVESKFGRTRSHTIHNSLEIPEDSKSLKLESDPRYNFALYTMTKSGPSLKIFSAENLDHELQESALNFIERQIQIKPSKSKPRLTAKFPKLMEWYMDDFGGTEKALVNWVKNVPELPLSIQTFVFKIDNSTRISFIDYAWDFYFSTQQKRAENIVS